MVTFYICFSYNQWASKAIVVDLTALVTAVPFVIILIYLVALMLGVPLPDLFSR